MPANANATAGRAASAGAMTPEAMNSTSESVPMVSAMANSATKKPIPPARFMMIWRNALLMASGVLV